MSITLTLRSFDRGIDDFIQQDDASQQRSNEVAARIVDRLG